MDLLSNLALGFSVAFTATNLLYCFFGVLIGTLVGVLPGLGPTATIAMLLPVTFGLPPETAIIMLAGIYYGTQYGGSTTAILLNLAGESSSVVTALDGYQMALKGRGGAALATAAIGSFFAGCVATLVLALFAPILAAVARTFGPPEYFSLMVLGLIASVALASGSVLKALAMVCLGLALGLAGLDIYTGLPRLTFGLIELSDGLDFVAVAMGMLGISEVLRNLEERHRTGATVTKVNRLMLTREDFRRIVGPIVRGTGLGTLLGVLPGGGAMLSSFASYAVEKRLSKTPEQFGQGMIEGVAGPESANNAGAQTSFIPMLTLGIPSNPVMALMIGALLIQGITPGPNVIGNNPSLFWGVVASMWIGNLMLIVLNLPLVGVWVRLLTMPYAILFPAIVVFCCVGAYSLGFSSTDVIVMLIFGLIGYLLIKLECEPAPFLLGFVIGPLLEENLRRAMLYSRGDPMTFVTSPLSGSLLLLGLVVLVVVVLPGIRRSRDKIFE